VAFRARILANSAAECLHADLHGARGAVAIGERVSRHQDEGSWDESAIKALKMGAFLAVTQGSEEPPRLNRVRVSGARRKKHGADLPESARESTFDSGGILAERSARHG